MQNGCKKTLINILKQQLNHQARQKYQKEATQTQDLLPAKPPQPLARGHNIPIKNTAMIGEPSSA